MRFRVNGSVPATLYHWHNSRSSYTACCAEFLLHTGYFNSATGVREIGQRIPRSAVGAQGVLLWHRSNKKLHLFEEAHKKSYSVGYTARIAVDCSLSALLLAPLLDTLSAPLRWLPSILGWH